MHPAEADPTLGTAILFNENLPHIAGSLQESLQQHLLLEHGAGIQTGSKSWFDISDFVYSFGPPVLSVNAHDLLWYFALQMLLHPIPLLVLCGLV